MEGSAVAGLLGRVYASGVGSHGPVEIASY
jgi:hypothetical protein